VWVAPVSEQVSLIIDVKPVITATVELRLRVYDGVLLQAHFDFLYY
jgi:hypothetical protein